MTATGDEYEEFVPVSHIVFTATAAGTFTVTELSTGHELARLEATTYEMNKVIPIDRNVNGLKLTIGGTGAGQIAVYLKKKV